MPDQGRPSLRKSPASLHINVICATLVVALLVVARNTLCQLHFDPAIAPPGGICSGIIQRLEFAIAGRGKAACLKPWNIETCGGVVSRRSNAFAIRGGMKPISVPPADGEASYVLKNRLECLPPPCARFKSKSSCPTKRCTWTTAGGCTVPSSPPPPPPADTSIWRNRTAAAYGAVTRYDGPDARWIYQGYVSNYTIAPLAPTVVGS